MTHDPRPSDPPRDARRAHLAREVLALAELAAETLDAAHLECVRDALVDALANDPARAA